MIRETEIWLFVSLIKQALRDVYRCDHAGHNVAVGRKSSLQNHAAHFDTIYSNSNVGSFHKCDNLGQNVAIARKSSNTIMQHVLMLFIAASIKMSFTSAIIQDKMLSLLARAVYVITKQFFAIF